MKKVIFLVILLFGSTSLFSFGIGIQGGADIGESSVGGLAITFKLDTQPWVFAANAQISSNLFGIGLSADNWLINDTIVGPLKWFIGWGLYGNVLITTNDVGFGAGARLPVGLNMNLVDGFIEPYLQIAPSIGFSAYKNFGFNWFIPINLGIRFWF